MSRKEVLIRTVAALAGDAAVGLAMASACTWVIQAAALGTFMTFMAWLVAIIAALALSQHVVHPLVATLVSDRKLDLAVDSLSSLFGAARDVGLTRNSPIWGDLRRHAGQFTKSFAR